MTLPTARRPVCLAVRPLAETLKAPVLPRGARMPCRVAPVAFFRGRRASVAGEGSGGRCRTLVLQPRVLQGVCPGHHDLELGSGLCSHLEASDLLCGRVAADGGTGSLNPTSRERATDGG